MIRHHDLTSFADEDIDLGNAAVLDGLNLFHQSRNVDRNAVSDDVCGVREADTRGKLMKRKLTVIVDDGVTGVGTALKAYNDVRIGGEHIGNLTFPFVAPVCTDNCSYHFKNLRKILLGKHNLFIILHLL